MRESGTARMSFASLAGAIAVLVAAAPALAATAAPLPARAGYGAIYVVDQTSQAGGGGQGAVIKVDPATGLRELISSNTRPAGAPIFEWPTGIDLGPRFDAESGTFSIYVADFACCNGGDGGVIRVNPDGADKGRRTLVSDNGRGSGTPFAEPVGVAVESSGDILVVDRDADGNGAVFRVDPATGDRTVVSSNSTGSGTTFQEPVAIGLNAEGDILVLDEDQGAPNGTLFEIDPVTGDRTVISDDANPAGAPNFSRLQGLPPHPASSIYVADADAFGGGTGGIMSVDSVPGSPTFGARTSISENADPFQAAPAPSFLDPSDIDLMPADLGGGLKVTDTNAPSIDGGVIDVDPANGTRVNFSSTTSPVDLPNFENPTGLVIDRLKYDFLRIPSLVSILRPVRLAYAVNVAARATFTIERRLPGRLSDGVCRRATKPAPRGRRCTFYARVGAFEHRARPRTNRARVPGRIVGALKPGASYRLTGTARTSRGDVAPASSVDFEAGRG